MIVRYDMQCDTCDGVVEVVRTSGDTSQQPCCCLKTCPGRMSWKPSVQVQPAFKPVWHEHLANEPVLLTSREQYRDELRKRNLRGPYETGLENRQEV